MTLRQDTAITGIFIALGANLPVGDAAPEQTLAQALAALPAEGLGVVRASRFYKTPCFPAGAGPDYVNAAAELRSESAVDAGAVLAALHRIEARFGRERLNRWGMRTLDLDLLAMGESVQPDAATQDAWRGLPVEDQARLAPDRLILPHPRLQDRAFVLVPLADVAPDWRHPRLGQTVSQMLAALPEADRQAVVAL
ncbi:MAG: 2-amino-4-hydroxy-6-hydroxymethyldihydropteridine diphosphokinase [Paracoccaceae bacterium]